MDLGRGGQARTRTSTKFELKADANDQEGGSTLVSGQVDDMTGNSC